VSTGHGSGSASGAALRTMPFLAPERLLACCVPCPVANTGLLLGKLCCDFVLFLFSSGSEVLPTASMRLGDKPDYGWGTVEELAISHPGRDLSQATGSLCPCGRFSPQQALTLRKVGVAVTDPAEVV
jgi:hypothetical protein